MSLQFLLFWCVTSHQQPHQHHHTYPPKIPPHLLHPLDGVWYNHNDELLTLRLQDKNIVGIYNNYDLRLDVRGNYLEYSNYVYLIFSTLPNSSPYLNKDELWIEWTGVCTTARSMFTNYTSIKRLGNEWITETSSTSFLKKI